MQRPFLRDLLWECLRSGTLASLAMMPFGALFRWLGLRVGHYGPKFAAWLFGTEPGPVLLFAQHLVLGWLSALPLLLVLVLPLRALATRRARLVVSAAYGAGYYAAVNALGLPWFFGDPSPLLLGWPVVYPSLVVHVVFGLVIGQASGGFVERTRPSLERTRHSRSHRAEA
jgi:hypothetical protein